MSNELLGKKYENACSLIDNEISLIKKIDYISNNKEFKKEVVDLEKSLFEKRKNKFTISVCGIVKAGKSTFINSILFGKRVLPAFDTPWSAKLTFVEYTDKKPYFEAVFYSKEEFEALENAYKDQDQDKDKDTGVSLYKVFEKMKAKAFQKGIRKDDYIKSTNHTEIRYSFDDLEEFVTDLNNDKAVKAKYTPYVKEVHVYVNDKSIEKFRIVDTPGLHDTNVINSQETLKWVINTHALIFLLPPKGLTEDDYEFLKEYQAAKGPEGRIFVINRIDESSVEEAASVRTFLKELGAEHRFKEINMFGFNEVICRYSSLAKMLQSMYKKHIPFEEKYEDEWYWEEGGKDGLKNFEADPDDVKSKISERLYNNAGKIIINSSVSDISQLYFRIQKALDKEYDENEMQIKDIDKNYAELEKEINSLQKLKYELQDNISLFKNEAENEVDNYESIIIYKLDSICGELTIDVSNKDFWELKNLPSKLGIKIQKYLDLETGVLGQEIRKYIRNMPIIIGDIIKKTRKIYEENGISEPVLLKPFDRDVLGDWDSVLESKKIEFSKNLDEVLPWNWFTQLFTSKGTMRENARKVINNTIIDLRRFVGEQIKHSRDAFIRYIDSHITELIATTNNAITSKRKIVESNQEKIKANALKLKELNKNLKLELDDLKSKIESFKSKCSNL